MANPQQDIEQYLPMEMKEFDWDNTALQQVMYIKSLDPDQVIQIVSDIKTRTFRYMTYIKGVEHTEIVLFRGQVKNFNFPYVRQHITRP